MINIFRLFLFPFSIIYGFVILIRNKFYDWGIFTSTRFNLPIICIGNLAVGGTGKTPVTEYLVKLLDDKKIAILSRGYGRNTKGFVLANEQATADTIGDEPLQYYRKFKKVTVAVCEDRVKGVQMLKDTHEVILLDDAFQHRAIKAGFNILLFEFAAMHRFQMMLPTGNLRELFTACRRADELLVTKAPVVVNEDSKDLIRRKLNREAVSFATIKYGTLTSLYDNSSAILNEGDLFVLTGIANPQPMLAYLKKHSAHINHFEYSDHYQFSTADIKKLIDAFISCPSSNKMIITTEKDSQRLLSNNLKDLLLNLPVYYLPIEIDLLPDYKHAFDKKIRTYVTNA